ncbi:hypothetical protein [Salinimicrobium oceani]|uniref:YhhN-like protein n=1 Tax=Salinimicrobium oceani TaxID=2722702 RepID=A0ABX1CT47_9FLAO|nr:hypothetical protein [Salinimicrobium oceani]NJW51468.1 hypothetical protein [Salinimicrobium oceani]
MFTLLGLLFIVGSIFSFEQLAAIATVLLVPTLILYYRVVAQRWFLPMVVALLLLYARDLFMLQDFGENIELIFWSFSAAILILYIFAITGFQKSRMHLVEFFSLMIMYGFLAFLYYTIADLVPQVVPSLKMVIYFYIISLSLLLAITFTQYLLKSHYASLWLMLASASLLISELSLFFKLFVISDISVNIFFPLFHVLAYFAMVKHAINRRPSMRLPGF